MKFRLILIAIAAVAVVGASVALVYVWESPIAPVAPSSAGPFEPALVHEGALLAMAIESTIDDLAPASGQDVVAFRLKHLNDPRAVDVVQTAASRFGWASRFEDPAGAGRGFARYKNLEGWCAVAVEVAVQPDTGRVHVKRMVAAVDTGQVVNPDGIRNQVEGGMLQALSRNLFERMTFDRTRVTSIDWSAYPILRFGDVATASSALPKQSKDPQVQRSSIQSATRLVCACARFRLLLRRSKVQSDCDGGFPYLVTRATLSAVRHNMMPMGPAGII
jgi:Molybdopterin-binding domain of aldehyde dehydrogenase